VETRVYQHYRLHPIIPVMSYRPGQRPCWLLLGLAQTVLTRWRCPCNVLPLQRVLGFIILL